MKDPEGIPPVEQSFFDRLDKLLTPERIQRSLFFGPLGGRQVPRGGRIRESPSLIDERLYHIMKAWISEYEYKYGIAKGLWNYIKRYGRTLLTMGIITVITQLALALIQAYT